MDLKIHIRVIVRSPQELEIIWHGLIWSSSVEGSGVYIVMGTCLSMGRRGKQLNQISSEVPIKGEDLRGRVATAKKQHLYHAFIDAEKIKDERQ